MKKNEYLISSLILIMLGCVLWLSSSLLPGPKEVKVHDNVQGELDTRPWVFADTVYKLKIDWNS